MLLNSYRTSCKKQRWKEVQKQNRCSFFFAWETSGSWSGQCPRYFHCCCCLCWNRATAQRADYNVARGSRDGMGQEIGTDKRRNRDWIGCCPDQGRQGAQIGQCDNPYPRGNHRIIASSSQVPGWEKDHEPERYAGLHRDWPKVFQTYYFRVAHRALNVCE